MADTNLPTLGSSVAPRQRLTGSDVVDEAERLALPRTKDTNPSYGDSKPTRKARLAAPASTSETETVQNCLNLFFRARTIRRPLVAQWNRNYRILCNRTWLTNRPSYLPSPEVPEIYPILASQVGWMTDQRPTLEVNPASEPHSSFHEFYSTLAHDLQTALQASMFQSGFEGQAEQVVWDGLTYGTGILKTGWSATAAGGLGDGQITRVDPYTFYPDPHATSMDDANYFIEARTMSVQEMDRRWPGSMDYINPGIQHDTDKAPSMLDMSGGTARANAGAISPSTNPSYGQPGQSNRVHATEDPGVTVLECWLREHEYVEIEGTDTNTVKESWRVVVIAGTRILMDEKADELWGHGSHPYDKFTPHANGQFWGFSIVEWLVPSQLAINRLLASFMMNVDLSGNPVFMEDARAGISRTKITNKPGTRITTNNAEASKWMDPPTVSPQMFQLVDFFVNEMERVSGLTAISRGLNSGGRTAEGVIDQLQEASFVRVRMALRNFERALQGAGNKLATIIVENYTQPRLVQIVGPQANASSKALRSYHFYLPTPEGRLPMRYQLKIEAGSTLATSRQARITESDTLFAMGAIDELAVLEAHNYPNRAAIAERVMKAKAEGAMQPPGARQRAGRKS